MTHASRRPDPLVRSEFFEGSALLARDLRLAVGDDARRDALHVTAHHGTWGVAWGLRLSVVGGAKLAVSPGAAFTPSGNGLTLYLTAELDVPIGEWRVLLQLPTPTARCETPSTCTGTELPAPRASVRLEPWANGVGGCCDADPSTVPLGRVIRGASLVIALGSRQVARPLRRPAIVTGRAPAGSLSWLTVSGYELDSWVDTSSADMRGTPLYFVQLADLTATGTPVPAPLLRVRDAGASGFRLTAICGAASAAAANSARSLLQQSLAGTTVLWTALLPARGPAGGWS